MFVKSNRGWLVLAHISHGHRQFDEYLGLKETRDKSARRRGHQTRASTRPFIWDLNNGSRNVSRRGMAYAEVHQRAPQREKQVIIFASPIRRGGLTDYAI